MHVCKTFSVYSHDIDLGNAQRSGPQFCLCELNARSSSLQGRKLLLLELVFNFSLEVD